METTDVENIALHSESNSEKSDIPKKLGYGHAVWRYRDDGTYDKNPLSPTYYKDYYNAKLSYKVECEFCKKMLGQQKIKEHQQRDICLKRRTKLLQNSKTSEIKL